MTQTFDAQVSLTPSLSMLQILAFVVIGLMAIAFCSPPVTMAGKVGEIALLVGGVALGIGGSAALLGGAPIVATVAAIIVIGAGATAVVDGAIDIFTGDDTAS